MAGRWATLVGLALGAQMGSAPALRAQLPPDPPPSTEGEKALALRTALQAAGLSGDTQPRMVESTGQASDPRTIGVYLTVPDPELHGQPTELLIEVCLEPRVYIRSMSWAGRRARRATVAVPLAPAYEKARAFAARQFPLWDDQRAVLRGVRAWDGVSAERPVSDVEFTWGIEEAGLEVGWCQVALDGTPSLISAYYASIAPSAPQVKPELRTLSCLTVAEAFCKAGGWSPALIKGITYQPARPTAQGHGPHWGFSFWYTQEGFCGLTSCSIDAESRRLSVADRLRDDPDVVHAAEQNTGEPQTAPGERPSPVPAPHDERQAIEAAADFVGLPATALGPRVSWAQGWGGEDRATLAVRVPAMEDGPARTVQLEVQSGAPYYVSGAYSPAYPGLASRHAQLGEQGWPVAWDFARRHFGPWSSEMAGERPRSQPSADAVWYHATDHLVRTGTWALTEVQVHRAEGRVSWYVPRYEARRAPNRNLAEMTVDLLDAARVVRARVEAQAGAIFLLSYGVPVLSHPASPAQNPAWEIRYFVGPGGPRPIIRWAGVDATDGSLIYLDRETPYTCFEGSL